MKINNILKYTYFINDTQKLVELCDLKYLLFGDNVIEGSSSMLNLF